MHGNAFEAPQRLSRERPMSGRSRQSGDARSERERRLAEALRVNLKRRKAQQRERCRTSEDAAPPDARNTTGDSS
jgi:hypothetical protein